MVCATHLLVDIHSVTTSLENLDMLGNSAVVREMSGNWRFVRELSAKYPEKTL